jgi:hypothetical protein
MLQQHQSRRYTVEGRGDRANVCVAYAENLKIFLLCFISLLLTIVAKVSVVL